MIILGNMFWGDLSQFSVVLSPHWHTVSVRNSHVPVIHGIDQKASTQRLLVWIYDGIRLFRQRERVYQESQTVDRQQ